MATMGYFAYGSNMLTERLRARVPSARAVGFAVLEDHRLDFAKVSTDGSGKADVVHCAGTNTPGVLFEMDSSELGALDAFEGPDYQRLLVHVRTSDAVVEAICYVAKVGMRKPNLTPYGWYLALVCAGAIQHGLPAEHLEALRFARSSVDPQPDRRTRRAALAALDESGYRYVLDELPGGSTGHQ